MPDWASTLLGVAVGGALAFLTAIVAEQRRHGTEAASERRRSLATYLGRLYIVVGFMIQWPDELPPNMLERLRSVTLGQSARFRTRDWIQTQRALRKVFGEDLYEPLYRFTESYADLQLLPLDQEVRHKIVATTSYVERLAQSRSPKTRSEWPAIRRALLEAIAASGDTAAIEAAEPSQSAAVAAAEVTPTPTRPFRVLAVTLLGVGFATARIKHLLRQS